jgi:hypothetical protein
MRSIQDFKEEVKSHYVGQSLEVTVDRDPGINSTGNGISYRSLYTILCCLNQVQDPDDRFDFLECMHEREADGPGLYHRNPGDKTRNGIDDHLYAAAASCMIDHSRSVARAILNHARAHQYFFDDQNPMSHDPASWLGRYVWFPCFLELCAGQRPAWYDRAILMTSMLFVPSKDDAGAVLMKWVVAKIGITAGGLTALACKRAIRKMTVQYAGGLADAASAYFNRKGEPPHPLSWAEIWHNLI